jgi:predicted TIM-barrel fold metal-dependent hydrolase
MLMGAIAISADSHIVEPREVFDGVAERFGDRAPRIIQHPDWSDFLTTPAAGAGPMPGIAGLPVGRLGIAGRRLDDPETQRVMRKGYAGMNPGIADPVARMKEQDQDGVRGEVLYPSLFFRVFGLADMEVLQALFRSYNDWLMNYCSQEPDRLIGLALLPMQDPVAAVEELERVLKLGFKGACIPCTAIGGRPYHDPAYDKIWATAEEAGFPLSLHIFTGAHEGITGLRDVDPIAAYASAAVIIQLTLSDLICQGVAHRFPGLKFVSVEFNTGWLANWLERLDHAFYRARSSAPAELDLQPSEYWKRQFYATFEDDRNGILTRDVPGVETLMWGNDYPHHDSVWPHSQKVLDRVFEGVPNDVRRATTVTNVAALYGLPVPA